MALSHNRYTVLQCYKDQKPRLLKELYTEFKLIGVVANTAGSLGQCVLWLEHQGFLITTDRKGTDKIRQITEAGLEELKTKPKEPAKKGATKPSEEPEPRLNLSETAETVLESVALMAQQNSKARDFLSNLSLQIQREIDVTKKMEAPAKPKATKDKFMNDVNELHHENESLKYKLYQIHQLIEN